MTTNAPDKCILCAEKYDEEEKAPRSLPCLHYCCTECIANLILKQTEVCPYCGQSIQANGARDIGINTGDLDLLNLLKEKGKKLLKRQERGSASSSKQATLRQLKKATKKFTNEIIDSYQNAEERISSAFQSMKELEDNLLQEVRLMQDDILTKVKLLEKTIQEVQYFDGQIKRLENQQEAMRSKQSHMEEAIIKLDAAKTFKRSRTLRDEVEEVNAEAEENLEFFSQVMSRNETNLQIIEKVAKNTREKMRVIQEVLQSPAEGENEMQFLPQLQQLAIQEKLPQQITMNNIYQRNETMLRLMRQGKIYAEQEEGGRRRHARMTLDEENRICLHHLSDELLLPHDAHLLQHDDVMSVVNPSSAQRAFLEIGTDEESLGRIVINLKPKSKRAENFSALCSGIFGPTHVKRRILAVILKDNKGETAVFGDYEFNDGREGKEVIPGGVVEWRGAWGGPWVAGSVGGQNGGSAKSFPFGISTRDNPFLILPAVFGTVDTGLNVVRDAVSRYSDITKVKIIECGIILPI